MKPQKMRKVALGTAVFGICSALVTGCGNGQATQVGSVKTGGNASANQKQTLVVYEASGYASAVAHAFEKKTGIAVKLVHLATGPLSAKIEAEGRYPQWDIAWFDDQTTMEALDRLGLLNTGWAPGDIGNYTSQGRSMVPSNESYFPMGYTAAAVIAYNPKVLPPSQVPKTWSNLLAPEFRNSVAMNNPSISGPTYPFLAGIIQEKGLKAAKQFFLSLKQNGLQVYAKNGPTIQALLTGKVKIALAQDAALIGERATGSSIRLVYPSSGTFMLENVMGMSKNAPDKNAAERFIEYCLTPQAQRIMSNPQLGGSDSYRTSLIKGVTPVPLVHTAGVKWVNLNTVAAAKERTSALQWFTQNIVQ